MTPEYPAHPLTAPTLESLNLDQLREEIRTLAARVAEQEEAIADLRDLHIVYHGAPPEPEHRAKVTEAIDLQRDRIHDMETRLARLEQGDPQPCHRDRGEVLRALLQANGGKMPQSQARKLMRISKSALSHLLATMKDEVKVQPSRNDMRCNILILK